MADGGVISGDDDHEGSVFLRIERSGEPDRAWSPVTFLIEVDAEGYVPREVGLASDGRPTYVTRPGEYGIWNDSTIERTPPRTPEFAARWGRLGTPIDRDEFERAYADAVPSHETIAGTPIWQSDVVGLAVLLVLALLVFAAVSRNGLSAALAVLIVGAVAVVIWASDRRAGR